MALMYLLPAAAPASASIILGSTVIGVADSGDSNSLNGSRITVGSVDAVVTSMSVFVGSVDASPNNRYELAIYADGGGVPAALVVASATGTLVPNAWNTLPVSAGLQANTTYWLMYNSNGRTAALNNMSYSAGSAGSGAFSNGPVAFGSWPSNFGSASLTSAVYALYATAETGGADPRATVGEWSQVMNWPIVAIHANLLKTGKVLLWDEQESVTQPKLWDPASLALSDTPLVGSELFCSGHTQLADGQVVVAGGHAPHQGEAGTPFTYQYLPDTNAWIPTGDMLYDRWYPALTKLSDGRVAIFSGQITDNVFAHTPEIYEPASGSLTALTTISTPQLWEEEYPINFHLPSGTVLSMSPEHSGVQLFDADATTWTSFTTTPITLGSAVQYRPGKILMTGGGSGFFATSQGQAAVLDMNAPAPAWRSTNAMSLGRYMHNLVMLPMGDALAVGGSSTVYQQAASGPLPIELWNADNETWTTLAALAVPRMYHSTALLLPDGRVLAAGGGHNGAAPNYYSAQVFSPPYLFRGPRPAIANAPDAVPYGSSAFVVTSADAANISTVSLIGLGSVTHSTDMNQSYTELAFTKSAGQLLITGPANSDQVPPGHYMLFIVDADEVPSIATIVKIGAGSADETVSAVVSAGGALSTDNDGPGGAADGATVADPVETTVTTPNAGSLSISETVPSGLPPAGFGASDLLPQQVDVAAPPATAGNPLVATFLIDASRIPAGFDLDNVALFKDGAEVPDCAGASGVAVPNPCVSGRTLQGDGDVAINVLSSSGGVWRLVLRCGATATRPRLLLRKLNTAAGDDRLILQGSVSLPYPFNPPLDPIATGVRIVVAHGGGNLLDVTIPGGAFVEPPGVGWKVRGRQWTYSNKSATPPSGIVRLTIKDSSTATPGLVKFRATGRDGAYPVLPTDLPLTWRIALSPPVADCATASFPGPAPAPRCRVNTAGSTVTCK